MGQDNCEFAIIHLSKEWREEPELKMELVKPLQGTITSLQ